MEEQVGRGSPRNQTNNSTEKTSKNITSVLCEKMKTLKTTTQKK